MSHGQDALWTEAPSRLGAWEGALVVLATNTIHPQRLLIFACLRVHELAQAVKGKLLGRSLVTSVEFLHERTSLASLTQSAPADGCEMRCVLQWVRP